MIAGFIKVLLFYLAFVFIKNVIKGYLAYQGFKKKMHQNADPRQHTQGGPQSQTQRRSSQADVFEAEYRVLNDQK